MCSSDLYKLIDRRASTEASFEHWRSTSGSPTTQWVQLTFPVPILVRNVRLYGATDTGNSVGATAVRLYSDAGATLLVAQTTTGSVADNGTSALFSDQQARSIRVAFTQVSGTQAALREVEVIAAGGVGAAASPPAAPTNVRIIR